MIFHKYVEVEEIIKCCTEDSLPGLIVKSWWEIWETPAWLSSMVNVCFHEVSPVTPRRRCITSSPPAEIHFSMPEGEASIIPNNWTRVALGDGTKSCGKKSQPSGTRSLISGEIAIGPEGRPISLFSALLCLLISLRFPLFSLCQRSTA